MEGILVLLGLLVLYYFIGIFFGEWSLSRIKDLSQNKSELIASWDYFKEGIGSSVAGELIGIEKEVGPFAQNYYTIKKIPFLDNDNPAANKNGEKVGVWAGGKYKEYSDDGVKLLDKILKKVAIGEYVIINYVGLARGKQGRKNWHNFEVLKHTGSIGDTLSDKDWKVERVSDLYKLDVGSKHAETWQGMDGKIL